MTYKAIRKAISETAKRAGESTETRAALELEMRTAEHVARTARVGSQEQVDAARRSDFLQRALRV